ncbi:hypothetical protein DFAR_2470005 [Desulfarculales bacterium]
MAHNKFESARFAQVSDQALEKMTDGVEKALSESAARGFPVPGGDSLSVILDLTQEAKGVIVEGHGKIYEERSGQIFEIQKFVLEYLVKVAKFAMELYREQLFNAISLEQAQQAADTERSEPTSHGSTSKPKPAWPPSSEIRQTWRGALPHIGSSWWMPKRSPSTPNPFLRMPS